MWCAWQTRADQTIPDCSVSPVRRLSFVCREYGHGAWMWSPVVPPRDLLLPVHAVTLHMHQTIGLTGYIGPLTLTPTLT